MFVFHPGFIIFVNFPPIFHLRKWAKTKRKREKRRGSLHLFDSVWMEVLGKGEVSEFACALVRFLPDNWSSSGGKGVVEDEAMREG